MNTYLRNLISEHIPQPGAEGAAKARRQARDHQENKESGGPDQNEDTFLYNNPALESETPDSSAHADLYVNLVS